MRCDTYRSSRSTTPSSTGPGTACPAERRQRTGGQHARRDAYRSGDGRRRGGPARRLHQYRPAGLAVPRYRAQAPGRGLHRSAPRRAAAVFPGVPELLIQTEMSTTTRIPRRPPTAFCSRAFLLAAQHPGRSRRELADRRPRARGEGPRLRNALAHGRPTARPRHHARGGPDSSATSARTPSTMTISSAEEIAARAAVAVDNARRYTLERTTALALQRLCGSAAARRPGGRGGGASLPAGAPGPGWAATGST